MLFFLHLEELKWWSTTLEGVGTEMGRAPLLPTLLSRKSNQKVFKFDVIIMYYFVPLGYVNFDSVLVYYIKCNVS
jgi:hypothetical protein